VPAKVPASACWSLEYAAPIHGSPAPYFSWHAAGDPARLVDQCWAIKIAASDLLNKLGGTITHHHAVGRDHRRWYDRERPELFAQSLIAAKKRLDPKAMLNPGVLFDPE